MQIRKESRLTRTRARAVSLGAAALLAIGATSLGSLAVAQDTHQQDRTQERSRRHRGDQTRDRGTRDRVRPARHGRADTTRGQMDHGMAMDQAHAVDVLAAINNGEIELARFAQEHASAAPVREFAGELIRDHTDAQGRIDTWARSASVTPVANDVSNRLRSDVTSTRSRLEGLSGEAFDRAYLDAQASMHRGALDTIDNRILPGARNEGFRSLVQSIRSTVERHLTRVNELHGAMPMQTGGTAPQTGGTAPRTGGGTSPQTGGGTSPQTGGGTSPQTGGGMTPQPRTGGTSPQTGGGTTPQPRTGGTQPRHH